MGRTPANQSPFLLRCIVASGRLYQTMLLIYSRTLRQRYGPEMVQVFRTACRQAVERAGLAGLATLWLRTLPDLVTSASAERFESARERCSLSSAGLYAVAILLAYLSGAIHLHADADAISALILLTGAFLCGTLQPNGAWRWGFIIGLGIPLALLIRHGFAFTTVAERDHDTFLPLVLLPSLCASYVGALAHRVAAQLAR